MTEYGRWTYGDAGDEYPVRVGDVWRVGHHVLACADLETGQVGRFVDEYGPVDVCYADPPWDKGNARSFRTKAQVGRAVDFDLFLVSLVDVAQRADHAYIEMGKRNVVALQQTIEGMCGTVRDVWDIMYYRVKPCHLVGATFRNADDYPEHGDYTGLDDDHTPDETLSRYPAGRVVLDPCTGRGNTPIAAHKHGHRFIGTELHPRRLAVTIKKMIDTYSLTAEKIGQL